MGGAEIKTLRIEAVHGKGLSIRRISCRLAEVEVSGNTFEVYISNGIEMDFLKNESVCFLRKAENENRRSPFDLCSVYDGDTLVCVDTKEPLRIAEIWASKNLNNERGETRARAFAMNYCGG